MCVIICLKIDFIIKTFIWRCGYNSVHPHQLHVNDVQKLWEVSLVVLLQDWFEITNELLERDFASQGRRSGGYYVYDQSGIGFFNYNRIDRDHVSNLSWFSAPYTADVSHLLEQQIAEIVMCRALSELVCFPIQPIFHTISFKSNWCAFLCKIN